MEGALFTQSMALELASKVNLPGSSRELFA